jgi:hypothetical protein
LRRAKILTVALKEERVRWLNEIDALLFTKKFIPINSLISAASIIYFGPFDLKYR